MSLKRFSYRATYPMYVDEEISFGCKWRQGEEKVMDLWALQGGKVGMRADATFE
jgi:hydroxyacyl-ACP dehydratase HTD2-like protein with hotdog domain